jgi:hypothetical protein
MGAEFLFDPNLRKREIPFSADSVGMTYLAFQGQTV